MKYTTFIFDLDGTLLNTLDDLVNSVNYTLTKWNKKNKSYEQIRSYLGNGMEKLIELSLDEGKNTSNFIDILNDFKDYYLTHSNINTAPYDNIINILTYLKKNNYKTAIVSNKGDFAVKHLNEIYFKDLIDVAIGEKNDIARKPSPDTVNYAMKILNSSNEETFYIGDSEVDYETAKNANVECILVSWGFRTKEQLLKFNTKYLFDNTLDFFDFIKRINK